MAERFEDMLTGGHPNSLGRTVEVVDAVLTEPDRFAELFDTYRSDDAVVRLRVSSAMKRIETARRDLLIPYIDRFIQEIGSLDQASAQWTLAQLFDRMAGELSETQRIRAQDVMQHNLASHDDWIVLNTTMETLLNWSKQDVALQNWLRPHFQRLANDSRKSVAKRATKCLTQLDRLLEI